MPFPLLPLLLLLVLNQYGRPVAAADSGSASELDADAGAAKAFAEALIGSGCDESARRMAVISGLRLYLSSLNSSAFSELRVLVPDTYGAYLRTALARFSAATGVQVQLDVQPVTSLLGSIIADKELPLHDQHAVWLQTTMTTQQVAEEGMVTDMSSIVDLDDQMDWYDVFQLFRLQLASYQGRTVAIPLDGSTMYTLLRSDVLAALGLAAPESWQDLVRFAGAYAQARAAAAPAVAAKLPRYPLCIPRAPYCAMVSFFHAIWTSVGQTRGSKQGIHFNTTTLHPLLDSPAAVEAFRLFAALQAAAAPEDENATCSMGSLAFARGQCAITISGFVAQFRMHIRPEYGSTVPMSGVTVREGDKHGTNGVPGDHGWLAPCDAEACPYGTYRTVTYRNGTTATVLINHAPMSPGSNLAGAVNARMPAGTQFLAYQLLSYLSAPARLYDTGRYNASAAEGARAEPLLHSMAPLREAYATSGTLHVWEAAGYDMGTMTDSLPYLRFTRLHPNRAWDLRMPSHWVYLGLLSDILYDIRNGTVVVDGEAAAAAPPSPLLDGNGGVSVGRRRRRRLTAAAADDSSGVVPLSRALEVAQARLAEFYTPEVFLAKYLDSLAVIVQSTDEDAAAPTASSRRRGASPLAVAIAASAAAAAAAILVAGVLLLMRSRWRHRAQRRRDCSQWLWVGEPGMEARPVCLAVTDIENSTALWEALPAETMAECLRLHHACVRGALLKHNGYESATEGDSFILAFRCAREAVAFSLELQENLLLQPWPEALLAQKAGCVVTADPRDGLPFLPRNLYAAAAGDRSLRPNGPGDRSRADSRRSLRSALVTTAISFVSPRTVEQHRTGGAIGSSSGGGALGPAPLRAPLSASRAGKDGSRLRGLSMRVTSFVVRPPAAEAGAPGSAAASGAVGGSGTAGGGEAPHVARRSIARCPTSPALVAGTEPGHTRDSPRADSGDATADDLLSSGPELSGGSPHRHHGNAAAAAGAAPAAPAVHRSPSAAAVLTTPPARMRATPPVILTTSYGTATGTGTCTSTSDDTDGPERTAALAAAAVRRWRDGRLAASTAAQLGPGAAALPPRGPSDGSSLQSESADTDLEPGPERHAAPPPLLLQQQQRQSFSGRGGARGMRPGLLPPGRGPSSMSSGVSGAPVGRMASFRILGLPPAASASASTASLAPPMVPDTSTSCMSPAELVEEGDLPPSEEPTSRLPSAKALPGSTAPAAGAAAADAHARTRPPPPPQRSASRKPLALLRKLGLPFSSEATARQLEQQQQQQSQQQQQQQQPGHQEAAEAETEPGPQGAQWGRMQRLLASGRGATRASMDFGVGVISRVQSVTASITVLNRLSTQDEPSPHPRSTLPGSQATVDLDAEASGHHRRPVRSTLGQVLAALGIAAVAAAAGVLDGIDDEGDLEGLTQMAPAATTPPKTTVTLFRGLRVRVGLLWAAPAPSELSYNSAAARMVYGGACLAAAKVVADCAHGGQVLMSETAKDRLEAELGTGCGGRPSGTAVLLLGTYALPPRPPSNGARGGGAARSGTHCGDTASSTALARAGGAMPLSDLLSPTSPFFLNTTGAFSQSIVLSSSIPTTAGYATTESAQRCVAAAPEQRGLYWVATHAHALRLALLPPPRLPPEWTPLSNVYGAPVGMVSYVVLQVPAAATLLAWDAAVAGEALRLLRDAAAEGLAACAQQAGAAAGVLAGSVERGGVGGRAGGGGCTESGGAAGASTGGGGYIMVPTGNPGELHVAFSSASTALRWAEGLRVSLLHLPWPEALLQHAMCEEVLVAASAASAANAAMVAAAAAAHAAAAAAAAASAAALPSALELAGGSGRGGDGGGGPHNNSRSGNVSWRRRRMSIVTCTNAAADENLADTAVPEGMPLYASPSMGRGRLWSLMGSSQPRPTSAPISGPRRMGRILFAAAKDGGADAAAQVAAAADGDAAAGAADLEAGDGDGGTPRLAAGGMRKCGGSSYGTVDSRAPPPPPPLVTPWAALMAGPGMQLPPPLPLPPPPSSAGAAGASPSPPASASSFWNSARRWGRGSQQGLAGSGSASRQEQQAPSPTPLAKTLATPAVPATTHGGGISGGGGGGGTGSPLGRAGAARVATIVSAPAGGAAGAAAAAAAAASRARRWDGMWSGVTETTAEAAHVGPECTLSACDVALASPSPATLPRPSDMGYAEPMELTTAYSITPMHALAAHAASAVAPCELAAPAVSASSRRAHLVQAPIPPACLCTGPHESSSAITAAAAAAAATALPHAAASGSGGQAASSISLALPQRLANVLAAARGSGVGGGSSPRECRACGGVVGGGGGGGGGGGAAAGAGASTGGGRDGATSALQNLSSERLILLRGLRVRAGVCTDDVGLAVQDCTHALSYTGRPVRQARRLAGAAVSGQVLCDASTRQQVEIDGMWDNAAGGGGGGGVAELGGGAAAATCDGGVLVFTPAGGAGGAAAARKKALASAFVCRLYARDAGAYAVAPPAEGGARGKQRSQGQPPH